jgi:nucleoside-triphosphatase THEP1
LIIIITGDIGSGKSTLAERMSQIARQRGFSVGGTISRRRKVKKSGEIEYWVHCLQSGKERCFATTRPIKNALRLSRFFFSRPSIIFAARCLRRSLRCDFIFVDELGPLELQGKGLWRSTQFLFQNSAGTLVFIVRRALVEEVTTKLGIKPHLTLDTATIRADSCDSIFRQVLQKEVGQN